MSKTAFDKRQRAESILLNLKYPVGMIERLGQAAKGMGENCITGNMIIDSKCPDFIDERPWQRPPGRPEEG